jgi:colanic acid/amylovoran biosynthesis glycosyltransferase
LLATAVGIMAWYKLAEYLLYFQRRRNREKWLSEGFGQTKIIYLMTRYPLWSETFLRQDLQLLLQEGLPILPMALFPGDCPTQPEWPEAQILNTAKVFSQTSDKRSILWRRLRCFVPARAQCTLAVLRHRTLLRELVKLGRQHHVRHIHAEFADLGALLGAAAARRLSIRFSLGVHAADVYTNQYSLGYLCRKAEFITVCNRTAGAYLVGKYPSASKKLHLIHHGLNLEEWIFREKWGFQKLPELIFVGRFVAKKGISILLDSFALLLSRGCRLRLSLLGTGPMEEELRLKSEQLGIAEQIEWAGLLERKEVAERLRRADIFCLPSIKSVDRNQEGIPNVLVEAMALGVPVAGSQSGGINELLTAENGWPINELNPETFADTIEEMLRNPQECERRRRRGRQQVEAEFSASRTVKKRRRLLEEQ